MRGLWWFSWVFLGSAAIGHADAFLASGQGEDDAALLLSWWSLALSSAMVLMVVVVVKCVGRKPLSGDVHETKQEELLRKQAELKSHLWLALSQMEQELVKLVTLVRSRKARLVACHHSCKASECQKDKGSALKPFNLAVYDMVEED